MHTLLTRFVPALAVGAALATALPPAAAADPSEWPQPGSQPADVILRELESTGHTAGFLAIGLAVGGGRPVPIAMTSGTAVANLGPAVVEANYARVPLILLSANRPYELLGTGANQTIEQLGYFSTQLRTAVSLGLSEDEPARSDASSPSRRFEAQNAAWRSATCRVLAAATGARTANAGPVQFDIPLREPLVPDRDPADAPAGRPNCKPWTYTPPVTFDQPATVRVFTPISRTCPPSQSPPLPTPRPRCIHWP